MSHVAEHITNAATFASATALKNLSYIAAFILSIEWLGFDPKTLWIYTALMIIDVCTGVIRALMVEGGRAIRSALLRKGVVAKLLLMTALFSIALTGHGVGFDMANLVQGAVTVLILGECYSILGNVHSARTGKSKSEFDALNVVLHKFKALIDKVIA